MNANELRAQALEISNKAAIVIAENDTSEKLAEAQRMLDDADVLEARAANLDKIEARKAAYEAAAERLPVEGTTMVEERKADTMSAAFRSYLRGVDGDTEFRAQGISTKAGGGYLVPSGFYPELVKAMEAYGPMPAGGPATYLPTDSGNPLPISTFDGTGYKGRIIGEGEEAAEKNLTFGQKTLGAYKFTSDVIRLSNELIQDAAINPEAIVRDAMAEALGRVLNEMFTVGSGTNEPQGVVTGASLGVTSAAANAVSYDDLVNLEHSLNSAYRSKGKWMLNDQTFKLIRLLKDSEGRPLWQPSLIAGVAPTILGREFYINDDMADVATGATSILFGDFSKFTIRNVKAFGVKRLDERYATSDQVGFIGFGRYDSIVTDSRAIKKLVQA